MLKYSRIILFMLFCYGPHLLSVESDNQLSEPSQSEKKYELSIGAIFKNEAKNLEGWIDYHLNLGVDHFYLYCIKSNDYYEFVLAPYIQRGVVSLMHWPEMVSQEDSDTCRWILSTQIPAYENAVNFTAREETKWLVFMEVDEFLICSKCNVKEILSKYDVFAGITLASDIFKKAKPSSRLDKNQSSHLCESANAEGQIETRSVKKMIFKPDQCRGFTWPPYQCCLNPSQTSIEADVQEIQIYRFVNRNVKSRQSEPFFIDIQNRPIYSHTPEFLKKLIKKSEEEPFCSKDSI